ncbi:neutral and basic amino acid transport protein rBAT-like [Copidosoma floridanum]|uniref:neutral and basic amino acid transport protein rBAT-like n=1 Tax=Copidosoma floridanum TaxID=29053 RepID=UPI0006C9B8F5|nr:neutral and basic amino acid transport protein rBAT-like [Copidosoma floridanum]XP_023248134.1 neutral and basic amino acid transport protein rBAT-like [Copidosoma floridanum]
MSVPKPDGRLTLPITRAIDQQDEETSDCPLLTPSPPVKLVQSTLDDRSAFMARADTPLDEPLNNINSEDGLAFLNIVNSSCKGMDDEPTSRDPMVETSSNSGSSSDTNEPVCTQLLTQLNTAYTHLAPDAQALFYNQDNSGKPPLTGIQLVVPKSPEDYSFMKWNWPVIRKTCFWTFMSVFAGCVALVIGVLYTMPKRCDPKVEWWQGSLFYEIFPASFQDSVKNDGIGDLRGITNRLEYLEGLGVKGVRLNSIFLSTKYPQRYTELESLTEIDPALGTLDDFSKMVSAIHQRNMALVLDLPLYPFVENFDGATENRNLTDRPNERESPALPLPSSRSEAKRALLAPEVPTETFGPHPLDDNVVTRAIRFWHGRNVDGFYLKGLEHYTYEINFAAALRHWKSIVGPDKILVCSEKALATDSELARSAILSRVSLVDVTLDVVNGTKSIKDQVIKVLKGPLFQKANYPWVHWSTGSIDTFRLASKLKVANASVAIAMMGMMLPGTPSIFYGDEIGILSSASHGRRGGEPLGQLVPMRWDNVNANDEAFLASTTTPWTLKSTKPAVTNLTGLVSKMLRLRAEAVPIYVKAVLKNNEPVANCDVRYTADEMIVIERRYPRRNTYVFVSNLGPVSRTKDLSSLYYGGYVVVGPEHKLNRNIYFKELTILPGEAFVIKLDK